MNAFLKAVFALLKIAGAFILVMVALVIAGIYLNHRAEQRSAEFCESVAGGVKLSELISHAAQLGMKHYQNNHSDQHHFTFPGFVFNWSDCIVEAREGSVTQKWTTPSQD